MGMGILLYLLGLIVLISGVAWLATLVGIAQPYIACFALMLLAVVGVSSIMTARSRAREAHPV